MPEVKEFADSTIPQLAPWSKVIGPDYEMIGAPSAVLFAGLSRERFLHFYADDFHFNYNGATWFTATITPSILKAYDSLSRSSNGPPVALGP